MKISTDNYKNRPPTHLGDRFYIENLSNFLKKIQQNILEIAYCCLIHSGNKAVCYAAYTKSKEFLVEPLLSED